MNPVQQFYNEEIKREAVKEFLIATLKEMAIETIFNKKATAGIYEARKLIEKSFDRMEELFAKKSEPIIHNSR